MQVRDMFELDDQVTLVTGGSRGLGLRLAVDGGASIV